DDREFRAPLRPPGGGGQEGLRPDGVGRGRGGHGGVVGVLTEPDLVPVQARLEVVPGRELRLLCLGDLLTGAGAQRVIMRAAGCPAAPHDDAPSGSSRVNGWSGPSCGISLRRARYRWALTVFSATPRTAAISASFMSSCQRNTATACCRSGISRMIRQH